MDFSIRFQRWSKEEISGKKEAETPRKGRKTRDRSQKSEKSIKSEQSAKREKSVKREKKADRSEENQLLPRGGAAVNAGKLVARSGRHNDMLDKIDCYPIRLCISFPRT